MLLRSIYAVIVIGCLAGIALSQADRPAERLVVVANGSPADEDYHGARAFRDHVLAATQGRIAVDIFPLGQYCANARECIEFLEAGILDVFMTTAGGVGTWFGPAQVIDLPYLFADEATVECVLDGPFLDAMRQGVLAAGLGLRLMVVGNTGGWRSFATVARPVESPDDLQGLKIRSTVAPLQQLFIRESGASPTPISWSELYTAMATGVVDGTTNSLPDIVSANLHEQLKYITLDRHSYMGALWWLSQPTWEGLGDDDQRIIAEAFEVLKRTTRDKAHENEAAAQAAFDAAGGTILPLTRQARAPFMTAGAAARAWFAERYGKDWLDRLDSAITACRVPPEHS